MILDAEREASVHHFQADEEVEAVRSRLLGWYDENKRDLPWRRQVLMCTLPGIIYNSS